LSNSHEPVHDPGIDRATDGVAPKNILSAGAGEIAESDDFPIKGRKPRLTENALQRGVDRFCTPLYLQ
jgi:hypothetical protein